MRLKSRLRPRRYVASVAPSDGAGRDRPEAALPGEAPSSSTSAARLVYGEVFEHDASKPVYAAFLALEPARQHQLLALMQHRLAVPDMDQQSRRTRLHEAHRALAEASRLLGEAPTVSAFEELRGQHPEFGWPSPRSVRKWMGARSWNDALALAHLERARDGDLLLGQLGQRFQRDELITALRECATDLDRTPSCEDYMAWAHRPDVRRRPGRRALSQQPFVRIFGPWDGALVAAGLVTSEREAAVVTDRAMRTAGWFIDDESIFDALREVAARLRRSPRTTEYSYQRQQIYDETVAAGKPRAIPSLTSIQRRFRDWGEVVAAAGLEPLEEQSDRYHPNSELRAWMTNDELVAALRRAYDELGEPFKRGRYGAWRNKMIEDDPRERRRLPATGTLYNRFGDWHLMVVRFIYERDDSE
jgi:hypothetical protein